MTEQERAAMQQALKCLETPIHEQPLGMRTQTASALRAALTTSVPHGCHVDLEHGVEPDGCVLDEGKPMNCIYAMRLHREGKDKTACKYWQPIEVKK